MNCNNKTPYCNNYCDCVDWSNAEKWASHIHENFIIERDALTYESLDMLDSSPAVLCVLGKCKNCGKQICVGGELKAVKTSDALMERLFRDVFCCDRSIASEIEDAVFPLLHSDDRNRALDWVYLNHDKPCSGRFSGINPKFNERVRHVPGYALEVHKSLYTGLGTDNADIDMIAELANSDIEWLRQQHAIRVKREAEIADKISEYAKMWNKYALETRMFGDAIDVAVADRSTHTGNQWIESEDGCMRIHEISNAVYKMKIWVESPAPSAARQIGSVWWQLVLNVSDEISKRHDTEIIAKGRKDRIHLEEDADKYVAGRKKAYAKYFTEEYPPVPKEYAQYFSVDSVLLAGYTVEETK